MRNETIPEVTFEPTTLQANEDEKGWSLDAMAVGGRSLRHVGHILCKEDAHFITSAIRNFDEVVDFLQMLDNTEARHIGGDSLRTQARELLAKLEGRAPVEFRGYNLDNACGY